MIILIRFPITPLCVVKTTGLCGAWLDFTTGLAIYLHVVSTTIHSGMYVCSSQHACMIQDSHYTTKMKPFITHICIQNHVYGVRHHVYDGIQYHA